MRATPATGRAAGRSAELAEATRALDHAGGVALLGAAGAGKTHLARVLAGEGAVWVTATRAASTIPFGAFARYLADLPTTQATPALILRQLLFRLARPSATIVVDDVHLLDPGSAAVLHELGQDASVRLVLTVREGEPVPDAVQRLWLDGRTPPVWLAPLAAEALAELAADLTGAAWDPEAAASLHALARGNTLAGVALVRSAQADGALQRASDGRWRWQDGPPGGSVTRVLTDRLARLSRAEREILLLVTLAEPAPTDALASLADPATLESLSEQGWLGANPGGDLISLPHPLYGEVLLADASPLTLRRLRRSLADQLTGPDQLLRQVLLRLDAGVTPAGEDLLAAGEEALSRMDGALAERLARLARMSAGVSARQAVLLGRALSAQRRYAETETVLAEAVAADPDRLDLIGARVDNLVRGLRRADLAASFLESLPARPSTEMVVSLALATLRRRFAAAAAACADDPLLAGVDLTGPAGYAVYQLAGAYYQLGDFDSAIGVLRRHDRPGMPAELQLALRFGMIGSCLAAGRPEEASRLAQALASWGETIRWPAARGLAHAATGAIHAHHGDFAAAAIELRAALEVEDVLAAAHRHWIGCQLATAEAALGRIDAARSDLRAAAALRTGGFMPYVEADERRAVAFTASCVGMVATATSDLLALFEEQAAEDAHAVATEVALLLARVGDPGRAAELIERLPQPQGLLGVHVRFIRALAGRSADELLSTVDEYLEKGAPGLAAEAADAVLRVCPSAPAKVKASAAWRRDRLMAAHSVTVLPWWSTADATSLSPREHEIATLAAVGLSNQEIAARLVLSVRTVENHLHHIYAKLGVTGRAEIRTALRWAGQDR